MRQLFPGPLDPVDPVDVYGDPPRAGPGGRPGVRLNMIASVDGATTVAGVSGGPGGSTDHDLFILLRSLADVVLVAAGTAGPRATGRRGCRWRWSPAPAGWTGRRRSSPPRSPAPWWSPWPGRRPPPWPGRPRWPRWWWPATATSTWPWPWTPWAAAATGPSWPRAAPPATPSWPRPACS